MLSKRLLRNGMSYFWERVTRGSVSIRKKVFSLRSTALSLRISSYLSLFVSLGVLIAGCSLATPSYSTHEAGNSPGYSSSVSEVAWEWESPRGSGIPSLHRMDEGVVVLFEGGAFGLSGETGEELWSYYEPDQEFLVEVTDNGKYVVLHDEEVSRTVLLERDTGRVAHEYILDMDEFDHTYRVQVGSLHEPLRGITGNMWVVRRQNELISYDLETGGEVWVAQDIARCPDQGSVNSLSVQEEVVVAATTCYEQPEDRESVEWVPDWDFTSELVGLDPRTGEQLWRVEHTLGKMPRESLQRNISSHPGGLVDIHYLDSPNLGSSLLDIETREAISLGSQKLLWSSPDGSRLGMWNSETGEYRVQARSGEVEHTLKPEIVADGFRVGLEGGVLYLKEWVWDASDPEEFAFFEGFDGSSSFIWDEGDRWRLWDALSVPGGVTIAYQAGGEASVMGLR